MATIFPSSVCEMPSQCQRLWVPPDALLYPSRRAYWQSIVGAFIRPRWIGCGNNYEPCRAAVKEFSSDFKRRALFEQGEMGMQGGMATILGFNLTQLLMRTQPGGISSQLHY